jgi:hypothetical protein
MRIQGFSIDPERLGDLPMKHPALNKCSIPRVLCICSDVPRSDSSRRTSMQPTVGATDAYSSDLGRVEVTPNGPS